MISGPREFAAEIIDVSAETSIVEDYNLEVRDNVVVRARVQLQKGFVDVYRNFDTGSVA